MDDDTRTYPGYLARLFGLILAIILFVFAVWFFVRLGDDSETGVVATPDEQFSVTENLLNGTEILSVDTGSDSLAAATESQIQNAASESGTLPNTGSFEITAIALSITALSLAGYKLMASRRQLHKTPLITS